MCEDAGMASGENSRHIPHGLLRGLSRDTLASGRGADLTHEYLEAGVHLIEKALDHDPRDGIHPFLGWLSQKAVIKATTGRGYLGGAEGTLRDRWQPHARYVSDLVLWIRNKRPDQSFPNRKAGLIQDALRSHATVSQLIRGLSHAAQDGILTNSRFRLQLLALSVLGSPRYRASKEYNDIAPSIYRDMDQQWLQIVHGYLKERGLELRPGIQESDLVEILIAVGEGLALRELADPTVGARHESRLRLQGTTALALFAACLDHQDGHTLDELVDNLARASSEYQSSADRAL
jgi:hypothetical protein